jgi:hypothetical protein
MGFGAALLAAERGENDLGRYCVLLIQNFSVGDGARVIYSLDIHVLY